MGLRCLLKLTLDFVVDLLEGLLHLLLLLHQAGGVHACGMEELVVFVFGHVAEEILLLQCTDLLVHAIACAPQALAQINRGVVQALALVASNDEWVGEHGECRDEDNGDDEDRQESDSHAGAAPERSAKTR